MPNPVIHFEILGKNGGKLQNFYAELFGWKINADNPMRYGIVDTGSEAGISGGIGDGQNGASWATFYVQVDDPGAYLKKIEKMGGKTIVPVTEIPNMVTLAVFADPEGHIVGLVKAA